MTDVVLRIELLHTDPLVWRRVLVPGKISLRRLHEVIQRVMGWDDAHLYEFECGGRRYGEPDPDGMRAIKGVAPAANTKLYTLVVRLSRREFHYLYDFGDGWEHRIIVEQSGLKMTNPCPRLLDGAMACPPEDIGGVGGYEALKAALLAGDADEEDDMRLEAIGTDFDLAHFDPERAEALLRPIQASFRRTQ